MLPLPRGKGIGDLRQINRPPFTQQLGPFGKNLSSADVTQLLNNLPGNGISFRIPLSELVEDLSVPEGFSSRLRCNMVLDIAPGYEKIQESFHRVLRRKLRKHGRATLSPADPDLIIDLYRQSAGLKAGLKEKHYAIIKRLINAALANNAAVCCRLDDPETGLLAAGFFPFYRGRLINTFASSTAVGYKKEGMTRLIVELIYAYGGPGQLLDFEGSDLTGVAEFFSSFGPDRKDYTEVSRTGFRRYLGRL